MAKILCPECWESPIQTMVTGLAAATNQQVTKSCWSGVYYNAKSFLSNQNQDRVTLVRNLIDERISATRDEETKGQLERIAASIKWDLFERPSPEKLSEWRETYPLDRRANSLGDETAMLPAISARPTTKEESEPSLSSTSLPANFRGILIQSGDSAAVIQPGMDSTVQITRTKSGYVITLESDTNNG